ncbi:MAG TPA: SDR family NAD(P)-dependent oxidoreductase [Bacteroidales bacterium]
MLKTKTILITGGGSGIGEALAANLAEDNKIIICGRNEDKLKRVATANRNVLYYVADISIPNEIDELFKKISGDGIVLDVLINNAGVVEQWDMTKKVLSSAQIFEKINTNLAAAIAVTQHFIYQANLSAENLIINITSEIALFPVPILPLYATSKAGLRVFTQVLRKQLKNTNFSVVEVLPPAVDTAMPKQLGNTGKLIHADAFAKSIIANVNKGKREFAPGTNVPLLKFFHKFLPNAGLTIIDKMSRKQLQVQ